jgi:hypothetical protein
MRIRETKSVSLLAVAAAGLVVGLAAPAAAHETGHLINGSDIRPNSVTGRQVKESTLGIVPRATEAHKLPALKWHALKLDNSWIVSDGRPAYAVDAQGLILLRGSIRGGNDDTEAFALPRAILPGRDQTVSVPTGGSTTGQLSIVATGQVYPEDDADHPGSTTSFVSLDGTVVTG